MAELMGRQGVRTSCDATHPEWVTPVGVVLPSELPETPSARCLLQGGGGAGMPSAEDAAAEEERKQ